MRVFGLIGYSKSGKTTTIENLIRELISRGYSVGVIKDVKHGDFTMDVEGKNTYRHKAAGALPVTARGDNETDVLYPRRLRVEEILAYYDNDFVILEGVREFDVPQILAGVDEKQLTERITDNVFAISGVISNTETEWRGLPIISALTDAARLIDLVEKHVPEFSPTYLPKVMSGGHEIKLSYGTLCELREIFGDDKIDLKYIP